MSNSSAYTAAGPIPVKKLNKQITKKSGKFRAANGYMFQGGQGTFSKKGTKRVYKKTSK